MLRENLHVFVSKITAPLEALPVSRELGANKDDMNLGQFLTSGCFSDENIMLEHFSLLTKLGWNLGKECTISFLHGFLCQTAARSLYREYARTCLYFPLPEIEIKQKCSYMHKSR